MLKLSKSEKNGIRALSLFNFGGHFGMQKTPEKVGQKNEWTGLYKYVEQFVRSCDVRL